MEIVTCKVIDCGRPVAVKKWQLCGRDYQFAYKAGTLGSSDSSLLTAMRLWECVMCGEAVESRRSQKYCSRSCENKWARTVGSKPCTVEGCDRPLVAAGLCSPHYKRKARAEGREVQQPWNDRRRANWQERYALKRGAVGSETLVAADVFERDRWVCGICGERIDSAVSYPDPLSVSLDHIVPLSKGGGHVLANVQASHLVCNVRKSNRVESARR